MKRIPSTMSLHLRYRIWISEMNFYINILRIFGDYMKELKFKKNEPEIKSGIDYFEGKFIAIRKEIDELRDQMHLVKMKLAAYSRVGKPLDYKTYLSDHHVMLKGRYITFRKTFDKVKIGFSDFEGKWMI